MFRYMCVIEPVMWLGVCVIEPVMWLGVCVHLSL